MNALRFFSFPLIIELVGALIFLLIFLKFIGKATGVTSFAQKVLWKLALAGFIIMAFISINTMMFHFEFAREAELAQAIRDFNASKMNIGIMGIEKSKSEVFTYETDRKTIHFLVQDISTKETAPCYISRDKTFIYLNESITKPLIIFNSTENTIDLHFPGDSREIHVDKMIKEEFPSTQWESEALRLFLTSIEVLE